MIVVIKGTSFQIDREDWERLRHKNWRADVTGQGRTVVVRQTGSSGNIKNIYIQHEIVGEIPQGMVVDHINRDTSDNRRKNLRICTYAENAMNRPPQSNNITGFKGVSPKKHRFCARIKFAGKVRILGSFPTPEQAAIAYDRAASKAFGEFAWLNSDHHPMLKINRGA